MMSVDLNKPTRSNKVPSTRPRVGPGASQAAREHMECEFDVVGVRPFGAVRVANLLNVLSMRRAVLED